MDAVFHPHMSFASTDLSREPTHTWFQHSGAPAGMTSAPAALRSRSAAVCRQQRLGGRSCGGSGGCPATRTAAAVVAEAAYAAVALRAIDTGGSIAVSTSPRVRRHL